MKIEELDTLRQDIQALTVAVGRLADAVASVSQSPIASLPIQIPDESPPAPACDHEEIAASYRAVSIEDIGFSPRTLSYLLNRDLVTLYDLATTTQSLYRIRPDPGRRIAFEIASYLDSIGLRLRGNEHSPLGMLPALPDDVTYRPYALDPANKEADEALIAGLLHDLGYQKWSREDRGLNWAMEYLRFAMRTPAFAHSPGIYLWPKMAERDGVNVSLISKEMRDSVNALNPTWQDFPSLMDGGDEIEDRDLKQVFCLARSVFWELAKNSYDGSRHCEPLNKLAAIARYLNRVNFHKHKLY